MLEGNYEDADSLSARDYPPHPHCPRIRRSTIAAP